MGRPHLTYAAGALILTASGILISPPAEAATITHRDWHCITDPVGYDFCPPSMKVPENDELWAGVDAGSADGVTFVAYADSNRDLRLGSCSVEPGQACRLWTNDVHRGWQTVAIQVHDRGWWDHDEHGGYEVRTR
jgi:hypothetical protein